MKGIPIVCAECGRTLKGRPARAGGWMVTDHLTPGRERCAGIDRTDHQSVDGTVPVPASSNRAARRYAARRRAAARPAPAPTSTVPAWLQARINAGRPGQEPTR